MASTSNFRSKACIALVGTVLGFLAGATSFLFSLILNPSITEYAAFNPLDDTAYRGGEIRVLASYEKAWDCGGRGVVTIANSRSGVSRNILEIQLGDRPPGKWHIVRRFKIPADAEPGETSLQETLLYDCGALRAVVRSPVVMFTVKE